jgi:hypothetical protein
MGASWGSLQDKGSQLGIIQSPRLLWINTKLELIGRKYVGDLEEYTVRYFSRSNGLTWVGPYYPDSAAYDDAGYCTMLEKSNGDFYMLSYAGTESDADIMEYIFAPFYGVYHNIRNMVIM